MTPQDFSILLIGIGVIANAVGLFAAHQQFKDVRAYIKQVEAQTEKALSGVQRLARTALMEIEGNEK